MSKSKIYCERTRTYCNLQAKSTFLENIQTLLGKKYFTYGTNNLYFKVINSTSNLFWIQNFNNNIYYLGNSSSSVWKWDWGSLLASLIITIWNSIKKILTEASTEHYDESVHDFGPHQLEEQFLQGKAEQATKRGCQIRHTGLSSL